MFMFNKLKEFKDMRDQAKELQAKLSAETVTVNAAVIDNNQSPEIV